jgi:hypothetical protein
VCVCHTSCEAKGSRAWGELSAVKRAVVRVPAKRSIYTEVSKEDDHPFDSSEFFLLTRDERSSARAHTVELDEPYDPLHIGALDVNGVVVETGHVTDFIKEFWLLTSRGVRHRDFHTSALKSLRMGIEQNCVKTPPISHCQGKMAG